jgi:hypothetical protein
MENTVKMTERQVKEEIAEYLRMERQTANYDYRICLNVVSDLFQHVVNEEKSLTWFISELEIAEIPGNVEIHDNVCYAGIFDIYQDAIEKICAYYINEKFEEVTGIKKENNNNTTIESLKEKIMKELKCYRDFHFEKEYGCSQTVTRYNFNILIDEIEYILKSETA